MKRWIVVCAVFALACTGARADVLAPGSKLRVTFRVDPAVPVPNVMYLHLGSNVPVTGFTSLSATLFDGPMLLGTYTAPPIPPYTGPYSLHPGAGWTDASSSYSFITTVVPFTSIPSGTIHGVIEVSIPTGSMDVDLARVDLELSRWSGGPFLFLSAPDPTIESVSIQSGDFTNVCPGDGTGATCPCGNDALLGSDTGCRSSLGHGARLVAMGAASVLADSLLLRGSQMPNSTAIYFQGSAAVAGGAGVSFGDGLRCVGGTIVRLGPKSNVAGTSEYPAQGDLPVSVKASLSAGDVRAYQIWYRDQAVFCTGASFNFSNALLVHWSP